MNAVVGGKLPTMANDCCSHESSVSLDDTGAPANADVATVRGIFLNDKFSLGLTQTKRREDQLPCKIIIK